MAFIPGQFGAPTLPFQGPISGFSRPQIAANPQLFQQLLGVVLGALQQLLSGWQGFGGTGPFPQPGYPGLPQPGIPGPYPPPFGSGPPFQPLPGTPGQPIGPAPAPGFDYRNLTSDFQSNNGVGQRTQLSGLNDQQRGVMHLWGIQMSSEGRQNGGVYFNVLNNPEQFKPAEVALVRDLYQRELQLFGGVTGRLLDEQFFGLYGQMTGRNDLAQRYANRPLEYARGPANLANRDTGNNGLSPFTNAVLRQWGHDRLDNGLQDGSILQFTLGSNTALDRNLNRGDLEALLAADVADNGRRDGTSLENAFINSLDQIYMGGPGASAQRTLSNAGINQSQVGSILNQLALNPPPGVPPGVDITNIQNIGRCPVLGPVVSQQGGPGGIRF